MDVRTLCLGLLTRGHATGYELRKMLQGPLGSFSGASFGSIYPALAGLAEDGLVTADEQSQAGRPDRKVYRITAKGRLAFLDALQRPVGRDRARSDFMAAILFADLLPVGAVAALLDRRVAELEARRAAIRAELAGLADEPARFVAELTLAQCAAELAFLDEHRHRLERAALV